MLLMINLLFFTSMSPSLDQEIFVLLFSLQTFFLKFSYPHLLSYYKFREGKGYIHTAASHYDIKRLICYCIRCPLKCFESMALPMSLHFKNAARGLAKVKAYSWRHLSFLQPLTLKEVWVHILCSTVLLIVVSKIISGITKLIYA